MTNSVEIVELSVSSCPVCGDTLGVVDSGQNCKGCGSRARLRSMAPVVKSYLAETMPALGATDRSLLAFAMTGAEKKMLAHLFKQFKSASLFGSYSSDHESGVDMRDLSRYADNSFSGVFGCLLFDYFPEHEQALAECFRVTAPGGIFLTHIAPYRIVDGDAAPLLKGAIKSRSGYFEYLPEQTELPDVKVGRDWFLGAMKRVGFTPKLIKVRDVVPGMVSEWFVGIKPGSLPSGGSVSRKPESVVFDNKFEARVSTLFYSSLPFGTSATLQIELLESPTSTLHFLEDHYRSAPDGGGEIREVVAANGARDRLYLSSDSGNTWRQIYPQARWDSQIRAVFSLADGGRLVRSFSGRMYHYSERGELLSEHATGSWHWHGSQGIGQAADVVLYAEYAPLREGDGTQSLNVWRYHPSVPSVGWRKVFTVPAAVRPPNGDIRHFHVCRPHPLQPRQWLLASGDTGTHCRLWSSFDDGETWAETHLPNPILSDGPEGRIPRLLRFTQFSVLSSGDLLWGTDDTSDAGRAALIRKSGPPGQPNFHLEQWLGKNAIRNIASYEGRVFLLLSESKGDPSAADCFIYDASRKRIVQFLLPNFSQSTHSVTDSLGSESLVKGVGFFPATGAILLDRSRRGILRISLKELS